MFVHVPTEPARLHAVHVPPHAVLQHTPSTQLPLEHSPAIEQAVPFANSAQLPAPLHVVAPMHSLAGSLLAAMFEQVPTDPALEHAWQIPLHAALQHTPSTHWVLEHSPAIEHAVPLLKSAQLPAPLQFVAPAHSLAGSVPDGTLVHDPRLPDTLHAWHDPPHVVLQQYPSMQFALRHSVAVAQTSPFTFLHVDAEHTCEPAHSLSGSVPLVIAAHVPFDPPVFAAEHAWHVVEHAELQQNPSTQNPLPHSAFCVHAPPITIGAHAPAPLHVCAPMHSFAGSEPLVMFEHVPTEPALLHAWQSPLHAELQQFPSTQKPLWHSAFSMHGPLTMSPHAPAPLQLVDPAHSFAGSVFAGTLVHVPRLPVTLHAWQVVPHAVLQQYPSTQLALTQSVATAHVSPLAFLHAPAEHTCVPAHSLSGSEPVVTLPHVPLLPPVFAAEHAWHVPEHAFAQHTPSTQNVLVHSAACVHAAPTAKSAHAPAPLQAVAPTHSLAGSLPFAMFEHVPTEPARLHAAHVPAHAVLQHTPSTQLPLTHSAPSEQAAPIAKNPHAPAPLQLTAPTHSFAGSCPFAMLEHVPSEPATLHAWHVPEQAALQQYPSTHEVLRHALPAAHVCPLSSLHKPAPLHAPFAHSFAGSIVFGMFVHVPSEPAMLHAWHVPLHTVPQQ